MRNFAATAVVSFLAAACGPACTPKKPPMDCSKGCDEHGTCTLVDGACKATTGADCKRSRYCAKYGECQLQGGGCVALSDDDCDGAELCHRGGLCTARDGRCITAKDADCEKGGLCQDGLCTASFGRCIATKASDCALTAACKAVGKCTPKHGRCELHTSADCAQATPCRERGACTYVDPVPNVHGAICLPMSQADCDQIAIGKFRFVASADPRIPARCEPTAGPKR